MTTLTAPRTFSTTAATAAPATGGSTAARIAGFAYVGAWVVGLTAFGVGPAADASEADVAQYFADHAVTTTAQSLLIHGVAAAALAVVLVAARRRHALSSVAFAAGMAGVALSSVQCVLDVLRSLVATGDTTVALVHAIDRIDGLKMFAFALLLWTGVGALRGRSLIGRPLVVVGRVGAIALVVSGIAYTGAVTSLLVSAELSLLLLLAWVAGVGIAVGRTAR